MKAAIKFYMPYSGKGVTPMHRLTLQSMAILLLLGMASSALAGQAGRAPASRKTWRANAQPASAPDLSTIRGVKLLDKPYAPLMTVVGGGCLDHSRMIKSSRLRKPGAWSIPMDS